MQNFNQLYFNSNGQIVFDLQYIFPYSMNVDKYSIMTILVLSHDQNRKWL